MKRLDIRTRSRVEFQDITSRVQELVASSGISKGICCLFVPHTTAAVTINEHADASVMTDIARQLDHLVPQHGDYSHLEGNAPAHIKASIVGSSETIFIDGNNLLLGTWQGIFFAEFDGPRQRTILVKIIEEGLS